MQVLITGGAGFVGLNLAEQLLMRGERVALFGPLPDQARRYLDRLRPLGGSLALIEGDVRDARALDEAIGSLAANRIVHAAAITAGLDREGRDARGIIDVNLLGTLEVLEAALRHSVAQIVLLGTGSVFGSAGRQHAWLDEQCSVPVPESLYGISKYAAERMAVRYRETRGLNAVVLRPAMVFGRWEYDTGLRDTLSLPLQLLQLAQQGEAAVIHEEAGDDWVYGTDAARGIMAVLEKERMPESVYHLSAGMRWSVRDWCSALKGRYPAFEYSFTLQQDRCTVARNQAPRRSPMAIDRLRRDAGYAPAFLQQAAFDDYMAWADGSKG